MKIIVVGAGDTGSSLMRDLSKDNHDVVAIDTDAETVQESIEKYDINGLVGNGCLSSTLEEAGAGNTDLLIAVTDRDEVNLLTCILAKSLGVKHLIAQVRKPEYFESYESMGEKFGIHQFVNLEATLAEKITSVLKAPAEANVSSFGGGRLEIADFPVVEGSRICGKSLFEVRKNHKREFLVVAIERDGEVIVPNGNTVIQAEDVISVCARHHELRDVLGYFGMEKQRVQSVMILGGGQEVYYLASELVDEQMTVKIVDPDRERCERIKSRLPQVVAICDDYSDKEVLLREGIDVMDAVVAMTPSDEKNIVASLYAKTFEIPKVVTIVFSDAYREMLEDISLNLVMSPYQLTGSAIAMHIRSIDVPEDSQIISMHAIARGKAEALEFNIGKNSSFVGKSIVQLSRDMRKGLLVCAVIRGRTSFVPHGDTVLEADDSIIVVSVEKKITKLEDILK